MLLTISVPDVEIPWWVPMPAMGVPSIQNMPSAFLFIQKIKIFVPGHTDSANWSSDAAIQNHLAANRDDTI